ncbi:hypothetical protein Dimus_014605 [Dionaea muscipula]
MDKFALILFVIITFGFIVLVLHGAPISSCAQTPYPSICNAFVSTAGNGMINNYQKNNNHSDDDHHHEAVVFRDMALKVTRNQAQAAYQLVSAMPAPSISLPSSDRRRAQLAWADCVDLYEDTLYLLDQIILLLTSSNYKSGDHHDHDHILEDAQTYLSAAVANQETCKNGFADLNISSYSWFPNNNHLLLSNLEKLLSNALAILNNLGGSGRGGGRRRCLSMDNIIDDSASFPSWVSSTDRRLLVQQYYYYSSSPPAASQLADVVVAKDGSGDYMTISEALASASFTSSGGNRLVIYVKAGVYNENIVVKRTMKNLMLIGDGIGATIVTGNKNAQDGSTTFRSATFAVSGGGFMARDMTFENTAGPEKHQAVAVRSGADLSVFYRCRFVGYQDTLYVYAMRQFYRECEVYGTVDFIFGDAAVVFQSCNIFVRKPMPNQVNTVTAQSRKDPNQNTGIVIHNSHITAASDLKAVEGSFKTYLGRPWKQYSRTVIIKSVLDGLINPQGWVPWSGSFALSTLYYAEYMNTGDGASTGGRVNWPGYHVLTDPTEAGIFTVGNFLDGERWIPTGVPFTSGL